MNFGEAIQAGFRNYFNFSGRARRSEFWYFFAFMMLAGSVVGIIDSQLFPAPERPAAGISFSMGFDSSNGPLSAIFSVLIIIPWLSATARRLHDVDKTGWWMLFGFIPIIGWITMIVFLARESDGDGNRFGHNPAVAA